MKIEWYTLNRPVNLIPNRPFKYKIPGKMLFLDQINDVYRFIKDETGIYKLRQLYNVFVENE